MNYRRLLLVFVPVVALTSAALAQFGIPVGRMDAQNKPMAARDKVAQYCRLDYSGARLAPEDWAKLQPIVKWSKNPEFPLIDVTSRFDVDQNVAPDHNRYLVTVHYRLLGRFNMGQGYTKEVAGTAEDVQFTVEEINGELKISDIYPNYPHPSKAAMLKWLQASQASAKDAHEKVVFDNAVEQLQTQSGSPFAR